MLDDKITKNPTGGKTVLPSRKTIFYRKAKVMRFGKYSLDTAFYNMDTQGISFYYFFLNT